MIGTRLTDSHLCRYINTRVVLIYYWVMFHQIEVEDGANSNVLKSIYGWFTMFPKWIEIYKNGKVRLLHTTGSPLHCQVEHHVRDKNFFFLSCITKMGQNFNNFFSWGDIHGIYYILKIHNQIWWYVFLIKTYRFQLEWRRIELKQLL